MKNKRIRNRLWKQFSGGLMQLQLKSSGGLDSCVTAGWLLGTVIPQAR